MTRLMTLAALALAGWTTTALAEGPNPSLGDLSSNPKMAAAFDKMVGETKVPDWIKDRIVSSPGQTVSFAGKDYLAMSGCEQHLCGPHQVAVLYDAEAGQMYGVLSESDELGGAESLTWLNIGGGPESIDGKTLLYATLTGSVENHPADFHYAAEGEAAPEAAETSN